MNPILEKFLSQIKDFWVGLPTPKRLALVLGTSLVLLGGILVAALSSRVSYGYLYTDLAPEDAAAITRELKKKNVPHQLEAGGTAILVPEKQRHALRLELASEGIPRGGSIGFELFDRAQIGATEFEQQVSLRRALEGELTRSISTVEGVKAARVHLVMPERRLFAMRDQSASASVVLKLSNPGAFGKREVAGIVHLVSSAVPGLNREQVSVVSTEGVTLHRPSTDGGIGGVDSSDVRAEQERAVAGRLEREVKEQLERVVGPGNADVRINVVLDTASTERTEEYWDKDTTALRSEHLVEEGVGAVEAGVAGVPGARTNLPDAIGEGERAGEATGDALGAGMRRARTRNWEVDRVTEKTSLPPGRVQRLSVAVLLNGAYQGTGADAAFVPRSPEQVAALEQVVRRSVGFDDQRGDAILVQAAQFARADDIPDAEPVVQWWRPYVVPGVLGAGALFLLSAVVLVWRTSKAKKQQREALSLPPALVAQQLMQDGQEDAPKALDTEVPQLLEAPPAHEQLREMALAMASKDPATAALVIKRWLASGDEASQAAG